jgi:hypothetical protein
MTSPNTAVAAMTALLALGACSVAADRPTATSRTTPSTAATSAPAPAPAPSTTTPPPSGGRGAAGLAATDRLERRHRLAQALPHSTAHYRIDFTVVADGRLAVVVTLLAVLNGPRDLARYAAELAQYKAEALAFIAAQGDDPTTYTVTFLPPDP